MTAIHLQHGTAAERIACHWLQQRGLRLLEANFRCKPGELDLIMLDNDCVVIVEVRYRARQTHGGALQSVTPAKQKKILRATHCYLQRHKELRSKPLRFDVLALHGPLDRPAASWCKRAFDATP